MQVAPVSNGDLGILVEEWEGNSAWPENNMKKNKDKKKLKKFTSIMKNQGLDQEVARKEDTTSRENEKEREKNKEKETIGGRTKDQEKGRKRRRRKIEEKEKNT